MLDLMAWVALTLTIVAAASVAWGITAAMGETDRSAQVREEKLVANGLRLRAAEIGKVLETETVWDDAVQNLDNNWNASWAESNLVQFFTATSGFRLVYVFDGQDRLRRGHDGTLDATEQTAAPAMSRLIAKVRAKELARGPFVVGPASKALISKPLQATEIAAIDGRIYILAASLVQPDFGTRWPSARAPVVVVGQEVNESFVERMSRYYLLDSARLEAAGAPSQAGWARTALNGSDGRPVKATNVSVPNC